jgi:hypothetical protein
MTSAEDPPSAISWRRVDVSSGLQSHSGWWRELGEQVHLESEYGNANAHVLGRSPAELAAELLAELVKRSTGRSDRT